jgi:uncharacterized membrane protein
MNGDEQYMGRESLSQRFGQIRSGVRSRLARWIAAGGTVLALVTVVVSALDAVSAQQAIAMSLVAGLTTMGGLIAVLVPDAWVAWRRGFRHGCEATLRADAHPLTVDTAPAPIRDSRFAPGGRSAG